MLSAALPTSRRRRTWQPRLLMIAFQGLFGGTALAMQVQAKHTLFSFYRKVDYSPTFAASLIGHVPPSRIPSFCHCAYPHIMIDHRGLMAGNLLLLLQLPHVELT